MPDILCDISLSRRLERAEAVANARFVEARARLQPHSGAQWIEVAGAYAMYDGPRSPCTQTFGLGLFEMPSEAHMDRIESFFRDRGAPVMHEVSPIADKALLPMLRARGYHPVELSTILFLPLGARASRPPDTRVAARTIDGDDIESWLRTFREGWRDVFPDPDMLDDLFRVSAYRDDFVPFLAELNGQPIGAASFTVHDGVALLAGASTIPEFRNRGAQRALLEARLQHAAESRCDLAMMGAEPGSASQRNAERQGFRIAYTRIKWGLDSPSIASEKVD
jgi:GNAT superfamily N-acetyltransferase